MNDSGETTTTNKDAPESGRAGPPARSWSFQLPTDDESSHTGGGADSDAGDNNAAMMMIDPKTSPRKVPSNRPFTEAERNLQNSNQVPLYKFVLTGGPCGGKTTGLARVYSFLRERGGLIRYILSVEFRVRVC